MRSLLLLVSFFFSLSVVAQLPDPVLTAAERREIAESLAKRLESTYVLPEPAKKMAAALRENIRRGAYDESPNAEAFVTKLQNDIRAVYDDRHLRVAISMNRLPEKPDPAEQERQKAAFDEDYRRWNYGLVTAKRLEGNIGYLDIEIFPPLAIAKATYDAAMAFLANTDALIIDVRRHVGGDPETVAYLVSHFVPQGTLINTIHNRADGTIEEHRAAAIPGRRYEKKVWVLTSARTFSGGEELAYDLQALKRATLVGEVTGGGAHPTRPFRIHERFLAFVPYERSINPVTKTNWEGVGVKPDVAVASAEALQIAEKAALESLNESKSAARP